MSRIIKYNPTEGERYVDVPLTDASISYMQDEDKFVADKVFPLVQVKKQTGIIVKYNKGDFLRAEARKRGQYTESAGTGYSIEMTDKYDCDITAIHTHVDDRDRANSMSPLAADLDAVQFVTNKIRIGKEVDFANSYFKPGVWGTDAKATVKWTDPNSNPASDIGLAYDAILEASGEIPNTLLLSHSAFRVLCDHAAIYPRTPHTEAQAVTESLLARLFNVDRVLVGRAVVNKAGKGVKADTKFVFGKNALLVYAPTAPSLKQLSGGYTVAWNEYEGIGANGMLIYSYPMPQLGKGTVRIEGEMAVQHKLVCPDVGVFFTDII